MKKNKDLNLAQATLIGLSCNIWYDESVDHICLRVNKWIVRHPILAGFVFAGMLMVGSLVGIVRGFISPADDVLDAGSLIFESASLSNEAVRKNRNDEA